MNASIRLLTVSEKGVKIMSRRKFNREGQIPHNLNEMINIKEVGNSMLPACQITDVLEYMHRYAWFTSETLWFHFLDDILDKWIYNNYKDKPFKYELVNMFEAPFDNYCHFSTDPQNAGWVLDNWSSSDYSYLKNRISEICHNVFLTNQEKYKKLFDAMTLEFNPLWNVDGTETTTRTLEKDGTISNAKDGYDELSNTGHDDITKSGKDYNIKSGSENTRRLGDDDTTYSGKEETKRNGDRTLKTEGGEISTHEEATTDSQSLITTTKDNTFYGVEGEQGELGSAKRETETYTNLKDEKTFTDREDSVHHDVTDTTTYNNVRDEMNFDSTQSTQYLSRHKTTYDVDDVQTFDTIDTERITLERHGNIGVTTTTKLLTELVDYAQYFNYVDIVAKDLINAICEGVY